MNCSCLTVLAQAAEIDQLTQVLRQLNLVQAPFNRARALSEQSANDWRYYFDYVHASQDVLAMKQGISQYFLPLPCSATINHVLSMVCESAPIAAFLIWCDRYKGI